MHALSFLEWYYEKEVYAFYNMNHLYVCGIDIRKELKRQNNTRNF